MSLFEGRRKMKERALRGNRNKQLGYTYWKCNNNTLYIFYKGMNPQKPEKILTSPLQMFQAYTAEWDYGERTTKFS